MLHHLTTLHLVDLKNNRSPMRLADNGCSLKSICFATDLILSFLEFSVEISVTIGFDIKTVFLPQVS